MGEQTVYITVNHLDEYGGFANYHIGDMLRIEKDLNNPYDDEAIAVYDKHDAKCGYVANSVDTVARGTYSAGRLYDKIIVERHCIIRFATQDMLICEMFQNQHKRNKDNKSSPIKDDSTEPGTVPIVEKQE